MDRDEASRSDGKSGATTSNDGSRADADGEADQTAESIGIIAFERKNNTAEAIADQFGDRYADCEVLPYHGDVFAEHWGAYDCFVCLMATGIAMRKAAPLLSDKWADPAIVVVDEALTWAIPLTGGHHGANQVAADLAAMGAVPAMTTASEVAGKQAVERRAEALDAHVETPDSTVATNLAVLDDDLGPVARLNGPQAVLVEDDVTILKRNRDAAEQNEEGENGDLEGEAEGKERPGLVLGTGTVSDVDPEQVHAAWKHALAAVGRDRDAVEFVATATRKADEPGLLAAAEAWDLGLVAFEKETLERFEGPSPTRSRELIGWPGIAEAAAIAGGREHELAREKERYDDAVTVAVGR